MQIKIMALAFTLLLSSNALIAQTSYYNADVSVGTGSKTFVGALSLTRNHTLLAQKLHLGYGLRFNLHSASNQTYITAPFKYTAEGLIDSVNINNVNTNSLSAMVNLGFSVSNKIMVGFNIDAVGFSFGSQKDITLKQWVDDPSGATQTTTNAKPTSANLLLVGDNDIGTLNSEFFIKYSITEYLGLRAGVSMFFSEYTSAIAGHDGNTRFRNKIQYPFAAISLKL
ncbi:MAG: hypothetical protein ACPGLV_10195 [Bacteroidia bacterium]